MWPVAQSSTTIGLPPEVLGPLGLTVFLLVLVIGGGRWLLQFIKEVIADIRAERDAANLRSKESDAAVDKMADSNQEMAALFKDGLAAIAEGLAGVEKRLEQVETRLERRKEPRP